MHVTGYFQLYMIVFETATEASCALYAIAKSLQQQFLILRFAFVTRIATADMVLHQCALCVYAHTWPSQETYSLTYILYY